MPLTKIKRQISKCFKAPFFAAVFLFLALAACETDHRNNPRSEYYDPRRPYYPPSSGQYTNPYGFTQPRYPYYEVDRNYVPPTPGGGYGTGFEDKYDPWF